MDLPIKIMMVLFVSLVVAWSMIQFSSNIIGDSKAKLADASTRFDEKDLEDKVIELGSGSDAQVFALAEECWNQGQKNLPAKELCFVVRYPGGVSVGGITSAWGSAVTAGAPYAANELSVISVGAGSSFIYWNPFSNPPRVEIEG